MILDLFAGPGGWSEGLRMLGLSDIGIEWDAAACATRAAAGHRTIRADVAQYPTEPFEGKVSGLIASPPCQDFSNAGKRAGRSGEKGQLIDEVPRWVNHLSPDWVACEQVPPALPVWEEFADLFYCWGYSVWCGILNAADFGVPQTRRRAILLASKHGVALPPEPTHARNPTPSLFGPELEPWVSMADALGWGTSRHPSPVVMTARNRQTGNDVLRGSSWRAEWWEREQAEETWVVDRRTQSHRSDGSPYPTVTVPMDRPSPAFTGKAGHQWMLTRPATTVCADPRLGAPGHHDEDNRQFDEENGAVKLTVAEALTLQSFDPAYPVQGTKTKQFEQVGNAVPPMLAAAIIGSLAAAGPVEGRS